MQFLSQYSAEIIALCALFFTAWQACIQRSHNKISVKPLLITHTARHKNNQIGMLELTLTNSGLGPAFIDEFSVLRDGTECNFEEEIKKVLGPLADNSSHTLLSAGYAMPHNGSVVLLSVNLPATSWQDMDDLDKKLNVLDLVIKYSSAYGDRFTLDTAEKRVKQAA